MNAALIAEGYRSAREVTRHHAKSFYFASVALFGQRRKSAFALYAFCRRLDDMVDEGQPLEGQPHDIASMQAQLTRARELVDALFVAGALRLPAELTWPRAELLALRDTIERYRLTPEPFHELINGMEMDLTLTRYQSAEQLDLYCYRVAGVVGLMMAPVLGCLDSRALKAAADLGHAMQLTNILRDVREDLERGRIYLPATELTRFGVTESMLRRGEVSDAWRSYARSLIARARSLYASGSTGIAALSGFGSQTLVRLMSTLYGSILNVIEARQYDVFSGRASVSFAGKLRLALGVFFSRRAPELPASTVEVATR